MEADWRRFQSIFRRSPPEDMAGSLQSNLTEKRDEKVCGVEGYLTKTCNQTGSTSSGDQRAQLEAKTKHNVEVQGTLDSFRSNQPQRRYEKVSGDEGYLNTTDNQTGAASTENPRAQLQAEMKHNREVQTTLESLRSDHIQSRDGIISGKMGDLTRECNHTSIAAKENQLVLFQDNCMLDSGKMGDLTRECNNTSIAAKENQLVLFQDNCILDLGAQTTSALDEVQSALTLIYRKRQELYSQICNTVDELALCEDNFDRILGGDVDLARQCINSIISGKFHSPVENRTQVHRNGNLPDENRNSQHGIPTRLSKVYLPGNSSCQDLEYTCQRNDWRLPWYLIQLSDGGFLSTVVVTGKDFELRAKGCVESHPRIARETAAAKMIAEMHKTWASTSATAEPTSVQPEQELSIGTPATKEAAAATPEGPKNTRPKQKTTRPAKTSTPIQDVPTNVQPTSVQDGAADVQPTPKPNAIEDEAPKSKRPKRKITRPTKYKDFSSYY